MLEFNTCPCAGNTLDRLVQPSILVVLAEGPLHGYRVAERISEQFSPEDQTPDKSGVYRFLKVMEEKGLVASSWDLSGNGPARRCYEITPDGERCLTRWIETLERYRCHINTLIRCANEVVAGRGD